MSRADAIVHLRSGLRRESRFPRLGAIVSWHSANGEVLGGGIWLLPGSDNGPYVVICYDGGHTVGTFTGAEAIELLACGRTA